MSLVGLGPGLTPSGDDLVGAAFLAHRLLAADPASAGRWRDCAGAVGAAAAALTHPISAVLLGDLLDGLAYEALHDLLAAVRAARPHDALGASAALIRIGHSSGWDMLAGVAVGLGAM
ncbi:MAG TPA: DUF2877 domain-containing protein, partial [Candidatus Tectomicrobia bacterium]|nr:DUF2877 domain-containing protein [Candidatus Tectomicrobia bacterium]